MKKVKGLLKKGKTLFEQDVAKFLLSLDFISFKTIYFPL